MKFYVYSFILCYIFGNINTIINALPITTNLKGQESSSIYLSETNIFKYENIKDLIVFGDSFSSVDTNFKTMKYTGKNRSGGKNWPLHLIDFHPMKLWNFAVRGAVVDFKIIPRSGFKVDFVKERKIFINNMVNGKFSKDWNSDTSLFAFWFGSNEIRSIDRNANVTAILENVENTFFNGIETIYQNGARNFLLLNASPVDMYPLNLNGKRNYFKDDVAHFNKAFEVFAKDFSERHKDANVILYNLESEYRHIIDNCSDYNFFDCRNNWSQNKKTQMLEFSLWSDASHLSYNGNKVIAKDMNDLLSSITK